MSLVLLFVQSMSAASPQALIPIEIPEAGPGSTVKMAAPNKPFFRQPRISAGEAEILLDANNLITFREQFDVDSHAPFHPYQWVEHVAIGKGKSRHLGYAFCSVRLKLGKGPVAVCLRDIDRDGRFEHVAQFASRVPSAGLDFRPLSPTPYRYADGSGSRQTRTSYTQSSLGLVYTYDEDAGRLRFNATVDMARTLDGVEVDPSRLPSTINVSGAVVRIEKWDGRRATLAVERPFPQLPLTAEYPDAKAPKDTRLARLTVLTEPIR